MQDKVVMGDQKDGLRGLTRFSDNEGDIIWPAWRAELKQRVAFEFGKIGNDVCRGFECFDDLIANLAKLQCNLLLQLCSPRWPNDIALVV